MGKEFGNFRLSLENIARLRDMRLAFESSYGRRMSNDEFINKLLASVEAGEPAVWEEYGRIVLKREKP